MSTTAIVWRDTIDPPWLELDAVRIGDAPIGLGTPEKYILLSENDAPVLRVDAYRNAEECHAFHDAVIWQGFLVIGWGDCAFLINIRSGTVIKHSLRMYFGHLYASDQFLLVASGDRLWRIHRDGSLAWTSKVLGIDGVVVRQVSDGVILGDGEWDPAGGWQSFCIRLASGEKVK